jgi:hypothetical protein
MLKSRLDLLPLAGRVEEERETPDLAKLQNEYLHIAFLTAVPSETSETDKDVERVITLRPEVTLAYFFKNRPWIHRGYFAVGRKCGDNVVFDFFMPPAGIKQTFPPKTLENAIAGFIPALFQEGYSVVPKSIIYLRERTSP